MTINTTRVRAARCPVCDAKIEAATSLTGQVPSAGDLSICVECLTLLRFDLALRELSEGEIVELPDEQRNQLLRYRREFKSMHQASADALVERAQMQRAPLNAKRIESVILFVMQSEEGAEGVPAFSAPDNLLMPLFAADEARAASLKPIAIAIAKRAQTKIKVVRFRDRVELETIEP